MSAHTPTPWRASPYSSIVGIGVVANRGIVVAGVHGDREQAVANAAFIVEACNSHAALTAENAELRAKLSEAIARLQENFRAD